MEYLNLFVEPIESNKGLEEGEYTIEHLLGKNYHIQHLQYNLKNEVIINAYCAPTNSRSVMFFYLGEKMTKIIDSMINHMYRYNESNMQRVWPHFYKAYKNANVKEQNKACVAQLQHYDNENIKYQVCLVEKPRLIDFWEEETFVTTFEKLYEYTCKMVDELLNYDDLPYDEKLNVFAKQFRAYYRANQVLGILSGLI